MMQTLVSAYDVYWPVTTKNVSKFVLELFHYWVNGVISNIFLHTMLGYCYLGRASITDYSKATRVRRFYTAYTGEVETITPVQYMSYDN